MGIWLAQNWAGVVAVFGIPIAIWATRKWGTRRARLQVLQESTGLLTAGDLVDKLTVTYQGTPVVNPHLVTLWIRNIGPKDITQSHFEGNRPLMFDLHSESYGMVSITSSDESKPKILIAAQQSQRDGPTNESLLIEPAHIPKGTEWVAKFIVSGPVRLTRRGVLIDTEITDGETTSRMITRIAFLLWGNPFNIAPITRRMYAVYESKKK